MFSALQWITVLFFKQVSHSTSLCACLGYEHYNNFLYIWGCRSNKISLAQTAFHIPVLYIGGCMLRSDLTEWPPNQIWSVHWATTGQITLESHWLMLSTKHQPLMSQWQSSVNLHNLNTLEDHWSHKYTGVLLEQHWLMLAASGVPVAIQC